MKHTKPANIQIISLLIPLLLSAFGNAANLPLLPLTTRQQTVRPIAIPTNTTLIYPAAVSNYAAYGYSAWTNGPGEDAGQQFLTSTNATQNNTPVTNAARLLHFFTLTDTHITDKESPNQSVAVAYQTGKGGNSSAYSPVMLSTTHVLDAAVKAANALHRQTPFDFGISLGDAGNSPQHNELRWFIDVLDGQYNTPSSGTNAGADTIDYQKPYQATGLDRSIPWYQTLGNHDHWWLGSYPVTEYFRECYTNKYILLMGDLFSEGVNSRTTYMGSIDGSTPWGDVIGAGPVTNYINAAGITNAPTVAADTNRYALTKRAWMKEFFTTTSKPVGHGFSQANVDADFACYSFEPKTDMPIKVIVLDDTQGDIDFNDHNNGYLSYTHFNWLVGELNKGQDENKLMIIAAHIPIEIIGYEAGNGNTNSPITSTELLAKLHTYPNLILWISGHVHRNKVTPQPSPYPDRPEYGFWEVETASLRDFPQNFRTFEILRNTDNTISILATDVDPAVEKGSPAEKSRGYAIGASRIFGSPATSFTDTASYVYNAELVKQLTPPMQAKIASYGGPLGHCLSIDRYGADAVITFTGNLQSADAIRGPWTDVAGATNQYTVPAQHAAKYYRASE
jgi:metallophosphoesterase (TIGR03768 family)